jgi:sterol desaturase/sphingolipid hydroxylase (fatty acid hydroxylase superfamily)
VTWALLSPGLIVLGAVVLIALERLFPYDRRQRLLRQGFWTDLVGYGLVQSYLLGLVITHAIGWMDRHTGLSRLHLVGDWPLLAQVAFFLVLHDLYIYWFHRLQHHSDLLWRTHEAHHSGDDVDWLSGTRSHSLEILINQTIEFAPIALLGAAPEMPLIKATIDALWGMYIHSNLDVRSGRLQYVLNGPEMHRWHHARDLCPPGKNFATKLAIWDWLFGTAHRPPFKPSGYGYDEPSYPRSGFWAWIRQHTYAFRRAANGAVTPAAQPE